MLTTSYSALYRIISQSYLTIFLFLISFTSTSFAQNIDNRCKPIKESAAKKIVNDLKIGKFDITELNFCQKRSYNLFIELIKDDPNNLIYADDSIKSNQLFIKSYVRQYPQILKYITPNLRLDKIFLKDIALLYSKALEYASPNILDNNKFMNDLIEVDSNNFLYASERLRSDFNFVLNVVKKNGEMLKHASDKLRNNKEIVISAINSYFPAINYASFNLKTKDQDIKNFLKSYNNSEFLNDIEQFLRSKYAGIPIGPSGSRGYRIVNQAKYLKQEPLILNDDYLIWRHIKKSNNNNVFITTTDLKKMSWKFDLREYPNLISKIDKILNKNLDKKTADSLFIKSLWQVSKNPHILIIDLSLLRDVNNIYNKSSNSNTSYATIIAFNKTSKPQQNINNKNNQDINNEEKNITIDKDKNIAKNNNNKNLEDEEKGGILNRVRNIFFKNTTVDKVEKKEVFQKLDNVIKNQPKWHITIVNSRFDVNLDNNILLENNYKSYEFWDIYNQNNNKDLALIFKVKGRNSEHFEILFKQNNNLYYSLYRGGGYNFNL